MGDDLDECTYRHDSVWQIYWRKHQIVKMRYRATCTAEENAHSKQDAGPAKMRQSYPEGDFNSRHVATMGRSHKQLCRNFRDHLRSGSPTVNIRTASGFSDWWISAR